MKKERFGALFIYGSWICPNDRFRPKAVIR